MKKKNNSGSKRKTVKEEPSPNSAENREAVNTSLDEEEQGFGGWLRSQDGLETMKLFVIANSIVMLTTIVYPHIQTVYGIVFDMLYGDDAFE